MLTAVIEVHLLHVDRHGYDMVAALEIEELERMFKQIDARSAPDAR